MVESSKGVEDLKEEGSRRGFFIILQIIILNLIEPIRDMILFMIPEGVKGINPFDALGFIFMFFVYFIIYKGWSWGRILFNVIVVIKSIIGLISIKYLLRYDYLSHNDTAMLLFEMNQIILIGGMIASAYILSRSKDVQLYFLRQQEKKVKKTKEFTFTLKFPKRIPLRNKTVHLKINERFYVVAFFNFMGILIIFSDPIGFGPMWYAVFFGVNLFYIVLVNYPSPKGNGLVTAQ